MDAIPNNSKPHQCETCREPIQGRPIAPAAGYYGFWCSASCWEDQLEHEGVAFREEACGDLAQWLAQSEREEPRRLDLFEALARQLAAVRELKRAAQGRSAA